jgi:hypothetical protein
MIDIVSRSDVFASMLASTPPAALAIDGTALRDLAAWCRRAVHFGGWLVGVESGTLEPWMRAFAHVVSLQDVLRAFDGRLRDGSPRVGSVERKERVVGAVTNPDGIAPTVIAYTPPAEPPPPKDTVPLVRHADVAGYEYDPSWVNGGMGGFRSERRSPAEPEKQLLGVEKFTTDEHPLLVREIHVHGINAFASLADAECQGIPELGWFYCGADFELGLFSSLEGFIATCLYGGPSESSSGHSPAGPGDLARLAAGQHRRILANLGSIAGRHQRALRRAYQDRRYPRSWVLENGAYGHGVAALVWAAAEQAGETRYKSGELIVGTETLRVLVEWARADWPTYDADIPGEGVALQVRVKRSAELVLWTAHERYRLAAALPPAPLPRKKKRQRREPPQLEQAGHSGRKRRVLIEVPRRPLDDESRAA